MPDPDINYKFFRNRGKSVCIVFMHFDCSTGLAGNNWAKLQKLEELRDNGHMDLIAAGDFNMTEDAWPDDILNRMNLQIITPSGKYTCKNVYNENEGSMIDYPLVSRTIVPLLRNLHTVGGEDQLQVPWSPHLGPSFEVHGVAGALWTQVQRKPKPLPIDIDSKGKYKPWVTSEEKWKEILDKTKNKAKHHIDSKRTEKSDQTKHVDRIGIRKEADDNGIDYAHWSMAAEMAQVFINSGKDDIQYDQTGRGCTPKLIWKNGYEKLSTKLVMQTQ